jgi:hypothetical protein
VKGHACRSPVAIDDRSPPLHQRRRGPVALQAQHLEGTDLADREEVSEQRLDLARAERAVLGAEPRQDETHIAVLREDRAQRRGLGGDEGLSELTGGDARRLGPVGLRARGYGP